jgi:prolyl oligopeptidase
MIQAARTVAAAAMLIVAIWVARGLAQGPPVAPIRNVTDTYFGVRVDDPYRYLENANDPDVTAWMKSQSDYTRRVLDRIPGRAALLSRINDITVDAASAQGGANINNVVRLAGNRYFYLKTRVPVDQTPKLYTRAGLDGAETLLVDPEVERRRTGKPHVIDDYAPSFDGKYVVYGISASGSEERVSHVLETATGQEVDTPIDRRFSAISWRPDGRSFFYSRGPEPAPGMIPSELRQRIQVFLHTLGQQPDTDPVVLGVDAPPAQGGINPPDIPTVITRPGSRWAVGLVRDNSTGGLSFYVASIEAVAGKGTPWRRVCDAADGVKPGRDEPFAVHQDALFLVTHRDAPHRKVVRIDLSEQNCRTATTIVPEGEAVIDGIEAARDAIYVVRHDGPAHEVLRVPVTAPDKPTPQTIRLPFDGIPRLMPLDPRVDGALLGMTGLVPPPHIYAYDPHAARTVDAGLQPARAADPSADFEVVHVKVKSHDGVLVPVSIVHKRGLQRNGANPVLLEGYGAYGISSEIVLRPPLRAWCELGGVYVVVHVRGGGEYGEAWHQAGYQATKPNTWKDAIAAAEHLIAEKYTSPARLAIRGASAGGILVGRAITERPDLFAVALPSVGLLDMLRSETTPNGVPNIPEFGTVKTERGFKALLAMSAYHHVQDGVRYPALLFEVGLNDARVEPWQSAKMAARLQAASASGKPVLFSMEEEAGHSIPMRNQRQGSVADAMAFALWQFGVREFQPAAK